MSESLTFRGFVTEQLAAAVENIRVLYERTIATCEEELCRSREENERKQRLLDKALSPRVLLLRVDTGPSLKTLHIKEEPEEQSITQEKEQLSLSVSEPSDVSVKTEETSQLHQRQTEGEDLSSELHIHSETEGDTDHSSDNDNDEDWQPPVRCPDAQVETEAHGDKQVQIRDKSIELSAQSKSFLGTSATVNKGDKSGTNQGTEGKKHQCSLCDRRFRTKQHLQYHVRVHTGEKPYCCSVCEKTFTQKGHLDAHRRTHTGEKPYCCSVCEKTFTHKCIINAHRRTHTGEKPYCCSVCEKTFTRKFTLDAHRRTHTGEKPYCCSVCEKTFGHKRSVKRHMSLHNLKNILTSNI